MHVPPRVPRANLESFWSILKKFTKIQILAGPRASKSLPREPPGPFWDKIVMEALLDSRVLGIGMAVQVKGPGNIGPGPRKLEPKWAGHTSTGDNS